MTVLLTGPSGVGKTAVAKAVAEELTGNAPIILNMTEYNDPATVNRIIGSPAGYIGSDSHAELPFDILESNPYQVIVLDEIEKCDKAVQRLFMSVFDEGQLKCSNGKSADFSKAIIFATTNAGKTVGSKSPIGFTQTTKTAAMEVSTLSQWFDLEFLNRFEAIINFEAIERDTYAAIVADKYARLVAENASDRRIAALPAAIPDDDLAEIVDETYNRDFGARPALRAVKRYIEDAILNARVAQLALTTDGSVTTIET
jgi:ATP-dependent Clp protease ATP-binding subunit ClpB